MMKTVSKDNGEPILKWFDKEVGNGENSLLVYPNLQTFRQIYAKYVKDQLAAREDEEEDSNLGMQSSSSKSRIILIAPFYETVDNVKHQLSALGVINLQRAVDNGSLVIVDSFHSFFPDINGMKKLIDSLSQRARKESRAGVTAIVDMDFFFLFGRDNMVADLINYEASLAPKTQDGNVKCFSCYHGGNYLTLTYADKARLTMGQKKKLLEVTENHNNTS